MVELEVRDDGVGASEIREGSLGYGLIKSLVQQINGQMEIRTEDGVTVMISFPDTNGISAPNR